MYGIEAINAVNGWAMAAVGALIVFSGLVMLSFIISQLHKFVPLLEKIGKKAAKPEAPPPTETLPVEKCPTDLKVQATLFEPLIEKLGSNFPLAELYSQAKEQNIPHPHLSLSAFRQAGILVPLGDGIFTWDKEQLTTVCKKG
ncbi:MAG: hypothetical protein GQ542_18640 [Desulforhopalus sp.]|nr:hypothetical protein [Desulforhopalus sp.]